MTVFLILIPLRQHNRQQDTHYVVCEGEIQNIVHKEPFHFNFNRCIQSTLNDKVCSGSKQSFTSESVIGCCVQQHLGLLDVCNDSLNVSRDGSVCKASLPIFPWILHKAESAMFLKSVSILGLHRQIQMLSCTLEKEIWLSSNFRHKARNCTHSRCPLILFQYICWNMKTVDVFANSDARAGRSEAHEAFCRMGRWDGCYCFKW